MKLDILAIGVHPDDIELCCGGVLAKEIKSGRTAGIIDLTQGELGTRGTIGTRYAEAADAAKILGVAVRENLKMRDGFYQNDEAHQLQLISKIRQYRPEIILGNILADRHPDHGRAGHLIKDACFLSGLAKIETMDANGKPQEKWRPKYVFQYIQDTFYEPDIIIDITDVMELKMQSVEAYATQFHTGAGGDGPQTYISTPEFKEAIIARNRLLGKRIGVKYGEGLLSTKRLGFPDLSGLILQET